jgi:hypothetical protein
MEAIDRCFSKATVEDIILALEKETGKHADWAKQTRGLT